MADGTISIRGNMTRDFELRFTNGGAAVASTSVAVSDRWKDKQGEWQEKTSFMNVVAWGQLGENCAQSLPKGTAIIVVGKPELREYDDREGNKRTVFEIKADFCGPDLNRATCEVERIARSGDDGPAPAQFRRPAAPVYDTEESEPF